MLKADTYEVRCFELSCSGYATLGHNYRNRHLGMPLGSALNLLVK